MLIVECPSPFRHIVILQLYNLHRFVPLTSLNSCLDSFDGTSETQCNECLTTVTVCQSVATDIYSEKFYSFPFFPMYEENILESNYEYLYFDLECVEFYDWFISTTNQEDRLASLGCMLLTQPRCSG